MEDIYVALKYGAKEDDLFAWYNYALEQHTEKKTCINLYNWLK